jgi:hypothetical protein
MARINLTQAINLTVLEEVNGKFRPKTLELKRGVNEVDPSVLTHPYILSHMKAGSASIVPDPMDPEDIARAAEEIARKARAQADAAKALKDAKQKEVDDVIAAASLKTDGPTIAEWVAAGYMAGNYPPSGYASRSTPEEIAEASKLQAAQVPAATVADIARVEGEIMNVQATVMSMNHPAAAPAPAAPEAPAAATNPAPSATEAAPAATAQAAPAAPAADAAPAAANPAPAA